jgi:AcrR family transcriptional regulator
MRVLRQLGREDWIAAGLDVLEAEGWQALRVQPVARRLGVSKGSFYWHFDDRNDWCDAVLAYWEYRAFAGLARRNPDPDPLAARVADWARHDLAAARVWARVTQEGRGRLPVGQAA